MKYRANHHKKEEIIMLESNLTTIGNKLKNYIPLVENIYGKKLKKMILFGSYARMENTDDSDIDIMIFLDVPHNQERNDIGILLDKTYDFNLENDVDIQPMTKSISFFNKWKKTLPFYKNIVKDGVILYDRT